MGFVCNWLSVCTNARKGCEVAKVFGDPGQLRHSRRYAHALSTRGKHIFGFVDYEPPSRAGKGLASSAALEVAVMQGLSIALQLQLDGKQLAEYCHKVGRHSDPANTLLDLFRQHG